MEPDRIGERPAGVWWGTDEERLPVRLSAVRAAGEAAYVDVGASRPDAQYLASLYLEKAVVGDEARGRLDHWLVLHEQVRSQELNVNPRVNILRETPGTALIDDVPGGRAILAREAMDLAISKARSVGIGYVGLRTTPMFLGDNAAQAAAVGMVGVVMTQTYPLVAPYGGRTPLLGNAPVAFAVPAEGRAPFIFDGSLTQTSSSGVKLAAQQGRTVPLGYILDADGNPTGRASDFPNTDAVTHDAQSANGSLVTLGGGHKGFGLVTVVTLLTSVLTDTAFPWEAEEVSRGLPTDENVQYGSTYMAFAPEKILGHSRVAARTSELIDQLKRAPLHAEADEILYPGEKSQRLKASRQKADAFLLPRSQADAVADLADRFGLASIYV